MQAHGHAWCCHAGGRSGRWLAGEPATAPGTAPLPGRAQALLGKFEAGIVLTTVDHLDHG